MKGISCSAFMYADDLVLLSPSMYKLQIMIKVCCVELKDINLNLNIKKSSCLRIGKNCFAKCIDITANNEPIPWVSEVKYLGITIVRGKTFKVSLAEAKGKFYSSFNALYSKLGCVLDVNVVVHLMEYIAVPVLCYALEGLDLTKSELSSLDYTLKRALFKIFKVSNAENLTMCMNIFNVTSIRDRYIMKKYSVINKMSLSTNIMLNNVTHGHNLL